MKKNCSCCGALMHLGISSWHWQCGACGYESAALESSINNPLLHNQVNEKGREKGLKSIRDKNFNQLLRLILQHRSPDQHKLLDVGAAHGWFVKIASEHFDVLGIEPDHAVCQRAREQGFPLIEGYFPDVLASDDLYDVIVFNDVLEHIPDVGSTLDACKKHLRHNGLLVLNLPSSEGFFYQLSKLLKKLGIRKFFNRMWQKGLPSPHLHYFQQNNFLGLTQRHGFDFVYSGELPSIHFDGLYDRIVHVGSNQKIRGCLIWCLVVIAIPFLRLFRSDIMTIIVRKREG